MTKHGNPRLRAALVELAWRLVRFQPNYKPIVKWRQILAKGALATGAARKKAIVAVARQSSRRSVENQNRQAPSRRAGLNQLKTSSRGTERRTLFEKINHFGMWALPGA